MYRDRLVALQVPGESFLLQRGTHNILVDGGYNSLSLISALITEGVTHIDIVVCTHADRDHAGGLTALLNLNGGITVEEFWLPGAWADPLPMLLSNPGAVVESLVNDLKELAATQPIKDVRHILEDYDLLESYLNAQILTRRGRYRFEEKDAYLRENLERKDESISRGWQNERVAEFSSNRNAASFFRDARIHLQKLGLGTSFTRYGIGAINTAERIRQIALQAIRHNVGIRWFDYGEFVKRSAATGGIPGLLEPLNSVELQTPPLPQPQWSYLAKLTPFNEECLAFVAPQQSLSCGVVFTGDSPLGTGPGYTQPSLCWPSHVAGPVIATAPHHGSENNSAAYRHLEQQVDVGLWMRSGGTRLHPGYTFRSISSHHRVCSHCPHKNKARRTVDMPLWGHFTYTFRLPVGRRCRC